MPRFTRHPTTSPLRKAGEEGPARLFSILRREEGRELAPGRGLVLEATTDIVIMAGGKRKEKSRLDGPFHLGIEVRERDGTICKRTSKHMNHKT